MGASVGDVKNAVIEGRYEFDEPRSRAYKSPRIQEPQRDTQAEILR